MQKLCRRLTTAYPGTAVAKTPLVLYQLDQSPGGRFGRSTGLGLASPAYACEPGGPCQPMRRLRLPAAVCLHHYTPVWPYCIVTCWARLSSCATVCAASSMPVVPASRMAACTASAVHATCANRPISSGKKRVRWQPATGEHGEIRRMDTFGSTRHDQGHARASTAQQPTCGAKK